MPSLVPAPSSLGLFSPALGPMFETSAADPGDLPELPVPSPDLSVARRFTPGAIWNAPANGTLSYLVATASRPPALARLRQANGSPAFADNALILLFRLLPEVAERLGALSQAVPRPDATTAPIDDQRTRPVITQLALELSPGTVASVANLQNILPAFDAADLRSVAAALADDAERAAYVGLTTSGGLANANKPAAILRRPETDERRLLENNSTAPIDAKLWTFTRGGRAFDPGTLAAIWARLAENDWDNLWAASDTTRQRTARVTDTRSVLLVNAHQGPLEEAVKNRITGNMTGLLPIEGSDVLFTVDTTATPAIALSSAASVDTDTVPIPRIAPLPAGPYAAPESATPFAGWAATTALARDFQRIAIMDVERHLVGLSRVADSAQADPRRRVTPGQNSADPLFLPTADSVATEVMARFADSGATVDFTAPELDRDYGPQPSAVLAAGDVFDNAFDEPVATAHSLKGSGEQSDSTAQGQSIVLRFDTTLVPGAWVRAWPVGRDTTTGRRFRMTGGAALADAAGSALILLPLPDGEAGGGTDSPPFSYDLLQTTTEGSRLYTDRRADRPAIDSSAGAADMGNLGALTLYSPETAGAPLAAASTIAPGHSLIAMAGAITAEDFTAVDMTTLRATDLSTSLPNSADGSDRIMTNAPAFTQTTPGDLPDSQVAGGPERLHETGFHTGAQGQEIYEFAAYDSTGNRGVIAAVAGRRRWHEAPPAAQAHPGVNAAPEIHGEGLGLAGPAADRLRLLMRERRPSDIVEFVSLMGRTFTAAEAPTTAGPWSAVLETAAKGTHGDLLMSLIPDTVDPGTVWDSADAANPGIKQRIDSVLASLSGGQTVDGIIDSTSFDDDIASAAFDRLLDKHRKGAQGFARAALAAIARAEDLIWLQTPALDADAWTDASGDIRILQALTDRLTANAALHLVLVLPKMHLPDRNLKVDAVRRSGLQKALADLAAAAAERVAWVSPTGGLGRDFHSAATTMIVDDAVLFTGAAHTGRRGLVFDAALTAALFDERLSFGRPQAVVNARRNAAGAVLGVQSSYVPLTGPDLVAALKAQASGGGFGRSDPSAYVPGPDPTSTADKDLWNPSVSSATNWTAFIALLSGDIATQFQNGTRPR
ncbi:hypothetical protein [Granulosicoccus antarcticus]|uniref:Uncharacterized protein n=1 Tax=Granulosicoccus antarcticus IMCC3135 TaxID=1192854 RepID=A0A2Z2NUA3_9GAMM|nr:hypothetical protein [Granulosicoccus antarcticus]ASJ73308.1 hypothetical protein IMCC3135_16130 [Granulosicoccus antarcticus IMCC3135]